MDGFREASAIACFIGIVIAIVDALIPSEKFNKQLKIMFAVVFCLCVITPIANGTIEFDSDSVAAYASADSMSESKIAGEEVLARAIGRNISRSLEEELRAQKITPQEIATTVNISENGSIDITVIDLQINPQDAARAVVIIKEKLAEEFIVNIYDGS
jgi:hypothetical protein